MVEMNEKIEQNKDIVMEEKAAVYAEESFIADVQFRIHNLLEQKKVSRAQLARAMGVTEARISHLFADNPRNLTLRTIARIFHALGEEAELTSLTLATLIPTALERSRRARTATLMRKIQTQDSLMEALARDAQCLEMRFKREANDNAGETQPALAA